MRTIGVVTTARSDYGIIRPVLDRIQADPALSLKLFVSGMHLSPEFGRTVTAIEQDGYPIAERIEMLLSSDSPEGVAKSMGLGVLGFAQAFARSRPDILVVLGDRFEMHAAALAALPFKIPVAHIHGGELTRGAMDDALRHSLTKLSHLHFPSTKTYAERIRQLGEESWRITVSGAPSLDHLRAVKLLDRSQVEAKLGFAIAPNLVLATFHPVTLQYTEMERQIGEFTSALRTVGAPVLFTLPNADTQGRALRQSIETAAAQSPHWHIRDNLGTLLYFSVMRLAGAMAGNSSSGIIEAPAFKLPVVNIGLRQEGRVKAANVIDAQPERSQLERALRQALSPAFRKSLAGMRNPYAQPKSAAQIIVRALKSAPLGDKLLIKEFVDFPSAQKKRRP